MELLWKNKEPGGKVFGNESIVILNCGTITLQIIGLILALIHFGPMFYFYILLKLRKTKEFWHFQEL